MNTYEKAIQWIHNHTVNDEGIILSTKNRVIYPEVTGYYIPSLLNVGETELARKFARKLCKMQKPDGSWYDFNNDSPFVFDTGQILKGLVAIRDMMPEVDEHIIKGIEWMLGNIDGEGHLVQPNTDIWGADDSHCNDLVHIYAVSPILEAARIFGRPDYEEKVNQILDYYIEYYRDRIVHYSLFSHFYAYVIEGLIDCGRTEIAREAMDNFEPYRKENGAVCAYNDVDWVCSTATFQFAIIWYKLGEKEKADRSFDYMCSLQNPNGGWYGCYTGSKLHETWLRVLHKMGKTRALYSRDAEISWAVKFFLDAAYWRKMSGGSFK